MSAPLPSAITAARAVEAWWAWSEHGALTDAARALGLGISALTQRTRTYKRQHGLPANATPWDPFGKMDPYAQKRDMARTRFNLDMLLEAMEHAEASGDEDLATHIRYRLHHLERRLYGRGLK